MIGAGLPAFSAAAEEKTEWTYDEMAEYAIEVENELLSTCEGQDEWCLDIKWQEMLRTGGKYSAVSIYDAHPFTITAFNPSKKTMRVTFRDHFLPTGTLHGPDGIQIKDLYVVRFEPGKMDYNYYQKFINNEGPKEGTHVDILEKGRETGWIPPNTEVTLNLLDGDFSSTETRFWWYFTSTIGNWADPYIFTDCLNSADYHEGMECQIVYNKYTTSYRPVEVIETRGRGMATMEPEPTDQNLEPADQQAATQIASTPASTEETAQKSPTTQPNLAPLAPDTGVETREESCLVEMPWWLYALIGAGLLLAFWWVLPTKFAKIQKKSKKVQKRG